MYSSQCSFVGCFSEGWLGAEKWLAGGKGGRGGSGVAVCQAIRALSYFVELKPALAPFDFWASLVFMCITHNPPSNPWSHILAERLVEFSLILHTRRAIWARFLTSPHNPFGICFCSFNANNFRYIVLLFLCSHAFFMRSDFVYVLRQMICCWT